MSPDGSPWGFRGGLGDAKVCPWDMPLGISWSVKDPLGGPPRYISEGFPGAPPKVSQGIVQGIPRPAGDSLGNPCGSPLGFLGVPGGTTGEALEAFFGIFLFGHLVKPRGDPLEDRWGVSGGIPGDPHATGDSFKSARKGPPGGCPRDPDPPWVPVHSRFATL
jgi:hypothetical protein